MLHTFNKRFFQEYQKNQTDAIMCFCFCGETKHFKDSTFEKVNEVRPKDCKINNLNTNYILIKI